MNVRKRKAVFYVTPEGRVPCEEWLEGLRDIDGKATIRARIRRLEQGNPGKCEPVGHGVYELKIYFGPGCRVYFGEDRGTWVILLCGGDKSTQAKDIRKAREYWADYRRKS